MISHDMIGFKVI